MAITHHFIVNLAALRAGKILPFKAYALLGDDLVIADDGVATEYRKLLLLLDMPISEAKTHRSYDLYEFAKRLVLKSEEVTPYSIAGIGSVYNRYALYRNFVTTQKAHGWHLPGSQSDPTHALRVGPSEQRSTGRDRDYVTSLHRILRGNRFSHRVVRSMISLMGVLDGLTWSKSGGDFVYTYLVCAQRFPRAGLAASLPVNFVDYLAFNDSLRLCFIEAKRRIIQRDTSRLLSDSSEVLAKLLHEAGIVLGPSVQGYTKLQAQLAPLLSVVFKMVNKGYAAYCSDNVDPDYD